MQRKQSIFWLIGLLLLCLIISQPALAAIDDEHGDVRIGIFPFEPINFIDESGEAKGFYPALLKEIAKKEGWVLKYVPGSWAEGLERLQSHDIDLMISVAYSDERAEIMDYTHESAIELWGQVFVKPDQKGINISDLAGQHVGVMKNDINGINLIKTAEKLGISFTCQEYATYADVFTAVKNGEVVAGVAPHHFGYRHDHKYGLIPSSIQFSPFSTYFVAQKGRHHKFLSTIDAYLYRWKADENSYYYQQLSYWLGVRGKDERFPAWFFPGVIGVVSVVFLLFILNLFLKSQVKKATTGLTQANYDLEESREKYRFLYDNAQAGLVRSRISDGKVLECNKRFADLLGYSGREDCLEHCYLEKHYVDPRLRGEIIKEVKVSSESKNFEGELIRRDGTKAWVRLSIKAYLEEGCLESVAIDISARKHAESELKASEQKYASLYHQFESLLDAISDPLVLLTPGMKPIWTNKAYDEVCTELGCGPESGLTLFHLHSEEQESPVLRCLKSGNVVEEMLLTPDQRSWGVKAFPLKDKAAQTTQVIAIAVDITEKIRLRKEADRASRLASLGELAAGIAHEINNPNAVVLLNMPIIRDVFADAENVLHDYFQEHGELSLGGIDYQDLQQELPVLIDRVQESAVRIKRIVEDLKNFVRDEGPKSYEQVDINRVVEAAVRLLENSIKKSTSHFRTELCRDLPALKGDFQKLEQVVINLIQNACQALTDSSQEVSVETAFDRDAEELVLRVRDQGRGIEQDQLSRLTDPFFTTKRSSGGTGLGLSVSQRILQEHQGRLQVVSEVDRGSVFEVFFPIHKGDE